MTQLHVAQLAIYPVKSMRQVLLEKAVIDMGGLKHDRRWMVIDAHGRMITQRQQARLCLIQPVLTEQGLRLSVAGMEDCFVAQPDARITLRVTVWKDRCAAWDAGNEAAAWLRRFLQIECRLVYFPDDEIRQVDPAYAAAGDRTAFSDGFPLLLISQASLDDLNERTSEVIPMARFRPNLVVSGCDPFAEDKWQRLRINDMIIRIVKPCSRCIIPAIDISTGERGEEPVRTLLTYRKRNNKLFFGQNAVIEGTGEIKTGMRAELLV